MNQEKWQEEILKSVKVLSNLKINLEDNYLTANAVLPFWQDFIVKHSDLNPDELQTWHNFKTGDEQIVFIAGIRPNLSFHLFWVEAMKKVIEVRK